MTAEPPKAEQTPFSRFLPLESYVESRPEIFQTKSSPKHLLRYRGHELQRAGAFLNVGRRMMIDPDLADELILAFFRNDGAIKPPVDQKSSNGSI
jgi:hypothetical protein